VADAFTGDVTEERQIVALVSAVADALGPVDVLVLNATGPQPEAPLTEMPWGDRVAQLDFFVKSPVLLGRAVIAGVQARGFGRIVRSTPRSWTDHLLVGPPTPPPRARRSGLLAAGRASSPRSGSP